MVSLLKIKHGFGVTCSTNSFIEKGEVVEINHQLLTLTKRISWAGGEEGGGRGLIRSLVRVRRLATEFTSD